MGPPRFTCSHPFDIQRLGEVEGSERARGRAGPGQDPGQLSRAPQTLAGLRWCLDVLGSLVGLEGAGLAPGGGSRVVEGGTAVLEFED